MTENRVRNRHAALLTCLGEYRVNVALQLSINNEENITIVHNLRTQKYIHCYSDVEVKSKLIIDRRISRTYSVPCFIF